MLRWRRAAVIGGTFVVCTTASSVQAQTGPRIAWDGQVAPAISGYAVTIDGVRTNYGTSPVINGACGCSIPAPFSGGRHTIVVIAYNSSGETPSAPLTVGPVANAGGPYSGTAGAAVAVIGSSSVAPTGSLTNYTWRWGDGTADTSSSSASASHVYAASGTFTVTLTVRDNAGATASASTTATIASAAQAPAALPTPWLTQDIGNVGLAGSASYSSGRFTVAGAGVDIYGNADAFRYVYHPLAGDGQIVARVVSTQNTHIYAKAGVMIRESLTPGSPQAAVVLLPDGTIEFLTRSVANGATTIPGTTSQSPPTWLKLVRTGNSIVASVSADGSAWSVVGTTNVTMTATVQIGLAVTSHTTSQLNTSVFDNVSVTTGSSTQPPATPSSPMPSNGATGVALTSSLTWSAIGATSYDVRFGTTNPPPQVATALASPSYRPASMNGNTKYYWQVVARNAGGSSTGPVWSFTAAPQSTSTAVPAPWANQDIGSVGLTGSASLSSGTFSVSGSGNDIWGKSDAFHYVHQPLTGDGQIVARVTSLENTHSAAAAGIMVRDTLTAGSRHVLLSVSPGGDVGLLRRANSGGTTSNVASGSQSTPAWLKLVRVGSTITGYVSNNGSAWTQVGSTTLTLGSTPSIGLIVTSHDDTTLNTATFDSVSVTYGGSAPPPTTSSGNVVIYASDIPASARHGSWQTASDPLSPGLVKLRTPDNGFQSSSAPLAAPTDYVDVTFNADANKPYRLWLRLRASGNSVSNDSVWVQFSDALVNGSPMFRTNTTSGLLVNLVEDASTFPLDWGWRNTTYWLSQPTTFTFPTSGMHTIRIQVREDGVEFDQIVLSPTTYLNTPPGPMTGDSTIVPKE
ncbi:MAG TPA: PKD domain-containing protein [Vicinamibacterales bacterium]|nr:PKD domain-containing protein [Vicinamibacterales bacterium]